MSFDAKKVAALAKAEIDVPWDDLREARVRKLALAAFRAGAHDEDDAVGTACGDHTASDDHTASERHTAYDGHTASDDLDEAENALLPAAPKVQSGDEEAIPESESPASRIDASLIPMKPARGRQVALLVALLAVAAAIALFVRTRGEDAAFAASTLHYRDGSRSLLSAQAQVHVVHDTPSHVAVQQKAGRVRYDIMKRPERHFVVNVGAVTITVLGTVFDVAVVHDQVTVSVERGRVRVSSEGRQLELTAGEQATVRTVPGPPSSTPDRSTTQLVDEAVEEADEPSRDVGREEAQAAKPSATPSVSASAAPSAAEWLRRADTARAAGQYEAALRALRSLIAAYPTDARATLALFTMGKVERQRGNHAAAARAFEQCGAALNGDAIAEAAASWQAAGRGGQASAAARRYLQSFPGGVHASAMRRLAGD